MANYLSLWRSHTSTHTFWSNCSPRPLMLETGSFHLHPPILLAERNKSSPQQLLSSPIYPTDHLASAASTSDAQHPCAGQTSEPRQRLRPPRFSSWPGNVNGDASGWCATFCCVYVCTCVCVCICVYGCMCVYGCGYGDSTF